MSYTPTTWTTGDTITASAMNKIENGIANAGSGYDAVIRLTHGDNSGQDVPANLTPSIISGTYAALYAKLSNGGCPCILVEYYHPWGIQYAAPMGYIANVMDTGVWITIAGYSVVEGAFITFGTLAWSSADTIAWD